jgi:hypothetical protein
VSHFARGLLGPKDREDDGVDGSEEDAMDDELYSLVYCFAGEPPCAG